MTIEVIDYRSIRTDLLARGTVLDVGARGFVFAKELAGRGCHVIAMDPDPEVIDPKWMNVTFEPTALCGDGDVRRSLVLDQNPEARFILPHTESPKYPVVVVNAVTIGTIMRKYNVDVFDAVKLNCEGEEAEILPRWPGPISKQIAVSFHEHYRPIGEERIQKIVDHLAQWYQPVFHEKDARYSSGENYWDSLFVLKRLK